MLYHQVLMLIHPTTFAPAILHYLARHATADATAVGDAIRHLAGQLTARHPDVDVETLINYEGRCKDLDMLRLAMRQLGYPPDVVETVAAVDNDLSPLSPWQVKQTARLGLPIPAAALEAAVAVVDQGMTVQAAAKRYGKAWNTVAQAARRLRYQRAQG